MPLGRGGLCFDLWPSEYSIPLVDGSHHELT